MKISVVPSVLMVLSMMCVYRSMLILISTLLPVCSRCLWPVIFLLIFVLCVILAVFFYRGQPRPCPICRSDGHRASSAICVLSVDAAFSLGILPGTVNLPRLNLTHPLFRMMFLLLMMMIISSLKSLCLKSLLTVMREVWRLLLPPLSLLFPFLRVFFLCAVKC